MGLAAYGSSAVLWLKIDKSEIFPIKGILAVVLSWFISPICSGIVSAAFFLTARTFILRAQDSYNRAFIFLPILVALAAFINAFYVLDKGITKQWGWLEEHGMGTSAWIAAIIGAVFGLGGIVFSMWLRKVVDQQIQDGTLAADLEAADMSTTILLAVKVQPCKISCIIDHKSDSIMLNLLGLAAFGNWYFAMHKPGYDASLHRIEILLSSGSVRPAQAQS
jgi:phosphate/sulfate permease